MNKKFYALLLALSILLSCLAGCNGNSGSTQTTGSTTAATSGVEYVDYAAQVQLDMSSPRLRQEVTVKAYVDGDTTHFHVPTSVSETGVLKARYLAVNTPESTGKIEAWGKKASNFTKEKLSGATSIIVESEDGNWNLDSTGGRHLVWIWYKPQGSDSYRNLNIELLQNGLSIASKSAETIYGEVCMAAIAQAKAEQLHVHSKQKDPDFHYGDAIPVTLKGLRTNIGLYEGMKVAFEGVVTRKNGQDIYVEEYDAETDVYYGIAVYLHFMTGTGLEILSPGNRVKIVGVATYYETGGTWQISSVQYVDMRPNDPNNVQLISEGNEPAYRLTSPEQLLDAKVETEVLESLDSEEPVEKTFDYADLAINSSISMKNLYVERVYTTTNPSSNDQGAMTLTCKVDGRTVSVRTEVLRDADGNLITEEAYKGKTINVQGIIDYFSGNYQIRVFTPEDITVIG